VPAGDFVFAEGDAADAFYEIVGGTVRLFKSLPDGRRQITAFITRGRFIGLGQGKVFGATAAAVTDVTLYRYGKAALERLAEAHGFAERLLRAAWQELNEVQSQILLLGRKSAIERMASFLIMMAERYRTDRAYEVELPMTRSDIADYLGLTVETVCRTLSRLKSDGLISLHGVGHITIRDRDAVERVAACEGHIACRVNETPTS
jgi:CRP/FNR family transcriptional regulator